jgi:hypothetical protein
MKVIFAAICALVPAVWTSVAPCVSDKGSFPKSVTVAGCGDELCDFVRGKSVIADFEFEASKYVLLLINSAVPMTI